MRERENKTKEKTFFASSFSFFNRVSVYGNIIYYKHRDVKKARKRIDNSQHAKLLWLYDPLSYKHINATILWYILYVILSQHLLYNFHFLI